MQDVFECTDISNASYWLKVSRRLCIIQIKCCSPKCFSNVAYYLLINLLISLIQAHFLGSDSSTAPLLLSNALFASFQFSCSESAHFHSHTPFPGRVNQDSLFFFNCVFFECVGFSYVI